VIRSLRIVHLSARLRERDAEHSIAVGVYNGTSPKSPTIVAQKGGETRFAESLAPQRLPRFRRDPAVGMALGVRSGLQPSYASYPVRTDSVGMASGARSGLQQKSCDGGHELFEGRNVPPGPFRFTTLLAWQQVKENLWRNDLWPPRLIYFLSLFGSSGHLKTGRNVSARSLCMPWGYTQRGMPG
jgi:hypothetical protein